MHEVSLVRSLLSQVLMAADPVPPALIRKILVSVGPLTGIEPLLVKHAFDHQSAAFNMDRCELEIEATILEGMCLDCNHIFEIVDFAFHCPICESVAIRVTQGDGFFLLRLEVEDIDSTLCSTAVHDTLSGKPRN